MEMQLDRLKCLVETLKRVTQIQNNHALNVRHVMKIVQYPKNKARAFMKICSFDDISKADIAHKTAEFVKYYMMI